MRFIKRVLFLPLYLLAVVVKLIADTMKKMFSFVCGTFFLMMVIFVLITIFNHAWKQTLLLMILILIGYMVLFGAIALNVVIEEFKNYCLKKTFW